MGERQTGSTAALIQQSQSSGRTSSTGSREWVLEESNADIDWKTDLADVLSI